MDNRVQKSDSNRGFIHAKRLNQFFFLKKWANPGLFLFIFILFLLQFQYKLKKA